MLYNRPSPVPLLASTSTVAALERLPLTNLGTSTDHLDYDVTLIVVVIAGKIVLFDSFVWVHFGLERRFFANTESFFG